MSAVTVMRWTVGTHGWPRQSVGSVHEINGHGEQNEREPNRESDQTVALINLYIP